jgi:gluconate 2-dehydrogenase subunit 3-like protein
MASAGETIRALASSIIPGVDVDETIGAAEIQAEAFIAHYLDFVQPGLADALPVLFDGLVAEARPDASFVDLEPAERLEILKRLGEHEVAELRDLADILVALTVAAFYGEWSGQDSDGALVARPVGWELVGFPGPVDGHPNLLRRR